MANLACRNAIQFQTLTIAGLFLVLLSPCVAAETTEDLGYVARLRLFQELISAADDPNEIAKYKCSMWVEYCQLGRFDEAIEQLNSVIDAPDVDPLYQQHAREFIVSVLIRKLQASENEEEFLQIRKRAVELTRQYLREFEQEDWEVQNIERRIEWLSDEWIQKRYYDESGNYLPHSVRKARAAEDAAASRQDQDDESMAEALLLDTLRESPAGSYERYLSDLIRKKRSALHQLRTQYYREGGRWRTKEDDLREARRAFVESLHQIAHQNRNLETIHHQALISTLSELLQLGREEEFIRIFEELKLDDFDPYRKWNHEAKTSSDWRRLYLGYWRNLELFEWNYHPETREMCRFAETKLKENLEEAAEWEIRHGWVSRLEEEDREKIRHYLVSRRLRSSAALAGLYAYRGRVEDTIAQHRRTIDLLESFEQAGEKIHPNLRHHLKFRVLNDKVLVQRAVGETEDELLAKMQEFEEYFADAQRQFPEQTPTEETSTSPSETVQQPATEQLLLFSEARLKDLTLTTTESAILNSLQERPASTREGYLVTFIHKKGADLQRLTRMYYKNPTEHARVQNAADQAYVDLCREIAKQRSDSEYVYYNAMIASLPSLFRLNEEAEYIRTFNVLKLYDYDSYKKRCGAAKSSEEYRNDYICYLDDLGEVRWHDLIDSEEMLELVEKNLHRMLEEAETWETKYDWINDLDEADRKAIRAYLDGCALNANYSLGFLYSRMDRKEAALRHHERALALLESVKLQAHEMRPEMRERMKSNTQRAIDYLREALSKSQEKDS